jgi:hypothetical protein
LLITVEDDGAGIAPEARSQILLRGQRADSYEPGQGIGLAVAVDILDSYGAELDIGSATLGGARFTIRWPSRSRATDQSLAANAARRISQNQRFDSASNRRAACLLNSDTRLRCRP